MATYTDSESAQIAVTAVHSLLALLDIAGNSLVCAVILKNKDMRTPVNYLLLNLAVADMTVATFFIPQYIFIHAFTHPDGVIGDVFCRLLTGGNLAWVGGACSVFTLVAIAIERFYAVMYLHGNKGKLTTKKIKVLIPCSWIFGVIMNTPEFLVKNFEKQQDFCTQFWPAEWMGKAFAITWWLVLGVSPVSIMLVLYSRVVYTLWFKQNASTEQTNMQQGVMKVRKRVTLMVILVSVIFGVSWLTDSTTFFLGYFSPSHSFGDVTYATASTMIMFNSAINPFIYALVNQRFREKIKGTICCSCRPNNRIHAETEPQKLGGTNSATNPTHTTWENPNE
ncbi:neuropeptide FF receptor 2-like [Stylophora pistillata]|uniref:neuropeptide FF receptor 2-like n=1 Tax=Stylophora pistillata TaxID=50429 RepID=UPI000C03C5C8|nr:neuropeptide FF receptor 2-like [Stylophora pistillata]